MILDADADVLVLLAVVNVGSTVILVGAAMRHHWAALEERATVAVILAFIAIGAATLALARLRILSLPSELSVGILATGLVLVSLPSLVWLLAFWGGRFDEPPPDAAARIVDEQLIGDRDYTGKGDH